MKLISLILAINLLTSSLQVCLGDTGCCDATEAVSEQAKTKKQSCCKSKSSENSSQDEKSPCKDGCTCCSVITVVALNSEIFSEFNPELTLQRKDCYRGYYSHDFTHLIWHPPQAA